MMAATAQAQQTFEEATRGMTPHQVEIFMRSAQQGAAMRAIDDRRRAEQAQADAEARAMAVKRVIASEWHGLGLDENEAWAAANVYEWTPAQDAINERIKREGWESGLRQAQAAYKAFNYQLADQLIIATKLALPPDPPPQ